MTLLIASPAATGRHAVDMGLDAASTPRFLMHAPVGARLAHFVENTLQGGFSVDYYLRAMTVWRGHFTATGGDVTSFSANAGSGSYANWYSIGGFAGDMSTLSALSHGMRDWGALSDWLFQGDDTLVGNRGNDILRGGSGNDQVDGGAGNDVLLGGIGNDVLTGGAGADRFILDAPAGQANADTVTDFVSGQDTLQLARIAMPALGTIGPLALDDPRFHAAPGAMGAEDAQDRLIYDTMSGNLYYDADGAVGTDAALIVTLVGHPALTAQDILVA